MKATLEFNLPEETHEHRDAIQGSQWKWAMSDIAEYLRNETKHVDHTVEEYNALHTVREKLFEVLEDRGLELYD